MRFASAPASPRVTTLRRQHGILPIRGLPPHRDWSERALQRTWKTGAILCLLIAAVLNAFVSKWSAIFLLAAGIWAHFKSDPALGGRLARHPVIGAPWRWWSTRGRARLPQSAPDTTPQL